MILSASDASSVLRIALPMPEQCICARPPGPAMARIIFWHSTWAR